MTAPDLDQFSGNKHAVEQRAEKAKALAKWLYAADKPAVEVVRGYSEGERKVVEKACGLRTSHRDLLWGITAGLLEERYAWDTRQSEQAAGVAAQLADGLPEPVRPPLPGLPVTRPDGLVDVCILRCLCGMHTWGGLRCKQHDRWVNPIPDPTRTLDALRAAAGLTAHTPARTGFDDKAERQGKRASGKLRRASR